ncbi:MAG: abortive infection system antitoxin AbiGi family protein [Motiliproteus sp.]
MQPKSHTLFHFTKNLTFLKDILKSGFWPRYCLEDVRWYTGADNQSAYPMVCFCDIPLSRVDEHVNFYGSFGIGVTKEWAKSNGLSPVIYINENTKQHQALKKLLGENLKGKQFYKGADVDINTIMTHIKPIEGNMFIGGEFISKEFYQENEWRYSVTGDSNTIKIKPFLIENLYKNEKTLENENNNSKEFYSIKISPSDIKYLFVKSDSYIPDLINFIQSELDHYPSAEIKMLMSRVTSLETISRDM